MPRSPADDVPKARDGLRIDGHTVLAAGVSVELDRAALAVLANCDGRRDAEDLAVELQSAGLPVSLPQVDVALKGLDAAGLLQWGPRTRRVRTLRHVRHDCVGCGRSCTDHVVGPLSDEEAERLDGLRRRLSESVPRLRHLSTTQLEPDGRRALSRPDRACLFLDPSAGCLIHARIGAADKPEGCQRFPLASVRYGGEVRVGIRPRCAFAHRSWRTGTEANLRGLAERTEAPLGRRDRRARVVQRVAERSLLKGLAAAEGDVAAVLAWMGGHGPSEPFAIPSWTVRACAEAAARMDPTLSELLEGRPSTPHTEELRAWLAWRPGGSALRAPPDWSAFAVHQVQSAVFVGDLWVLPEPTSGLVALLTGVVLALQRQAEEQSPPDEDAFDRFGNRVAAWNRMLLQMPLFGALFSTPQQVRTLLKAW